MSLIVIDILLFLFDMLIDKHDSALVFKNSVSHKYEIESSKKLNICQVCSERLE